MNDAESMMPKVYVDGILGLLWLVFDANMA